MVKNIGNVQSDVLMPEGTMCKISCYMRYDEKFLLILNSDNPIGGVLCDTLADVRAGFDALASQMRNHIMLELDEQFRFPNSIGYALICEFERLEYYEMTLTTAIERCRAHLNFFCRDSFLLTFQEWVLDLNDKTFELMPISPEWQYLLLSPNKIARDAYALFYQKYSQLRDELNSFVDKMYLFSEVTKCCREGKTVLSSCCAVGQNDYPNEVEIRKPEYLVLFSCVDTNACDRLLNIDVQTTNESKIYIKDFTVELKPSGEGIITVYSYPKCSANLPKITKEVVKFKLVQKG